MLNVEFGSFFEYLRGVSIAKNRSKVEHHSVGCSQMCHAFPVARHISPLPSHHEAHTKVAKSNKKRHVTGIGTESFELGLTERKIAFSFPNALSRVIAAKDCGKPRNELRIPRSFVDTIDDETIPPILIPFQPQFMHFSSSPLSCTLSFSHALSCLLEPFPPFLEAKKPRVAARASEVS